jgi:N-methylhydantoinase A
MSQIALDRDVGRLVCAVDIGGTFTDCVILGDDGRMGYGKALSSPSDDFESGFFSSIEAGAAQLGYAGDDVFGHLTRLVSHGSTVATNAVVEGKGAKVGLLTTKGHEDTILMMRGLGRVTGEPPENVLKVTETAKPKPLVPREHIRGVAERMDCSGRVLVALNENELEAEVRQLLADGCDSFAIAFLWSIQNDAHEQRAKELIQSIAPGVFVTTSSSISKAVGEYERTVAAVINSFVGPITTRYLQKIDHKLEELGFEGNMMLMQCHGGMVPLEDSLTSPVLTIGSGPVGGLIGTQRISEMLGLGDVIATDMGGTSFDVGIITGGEPLRAEEAVLGKYRYKLPAVEVLSIGAGGGSIAWVEPHSRSLRVGPESASSNPGPACYGMGGTQATVTDADLVLGYLSPTAVFGTSRDRAIRPDRQLAEDAIRRVAEPLGITVEEAASGIVEVAEVKMANLLQGMVIGRGLDPRDFTLVSYGGSGPLHAAGYAAELGVKTIVIPGAAASVWSAYGIAMSDIRYQLERDASLVSPFDPSDLAPSFDELGRQMKEERLRSLANSAQFRRFVRMRLEWQRHELEVPIPDGPLDSAAIDGVINEFRRSYGIRYGEGAMLADARLEIVSMRLEATVAVGVGSTSRRGQEAAETVVKENRTVYFKRGEDPVFADVYDGLNIPVDEPVRGPAVIDLPTTGIVVPRDASVVRTTAGDYVMTLMEA